MTRFKHKHDTRRSALRLCVCNRQHSAEMQLDGCEADSSSTPVPLPPLLKQSHAFPQWFVSNSPTLRAVDGELLKASNGSQRHGRQPASGAGVCLLL